MYDSGHFFRYAEVQARSLVLAVLPVVFLASACSPKSASTSIEVPAAKQSVPEPPQAERVKPVATSDDDPDTARTTQLDADSARRLMAQLPSLSRTHSYVGSDACRSCHPREHTSWHQSYHRTMTQLATPNNVLGDFQDTTIRSAGLDYRVFRKGQEFWAELPDPDRMLDMSRGDPTVIPEELPRVERRVLMTTGSHHYQTYWVGHSQLKTVLNTLPLVYLPKEARWIPREAAFMYPPDQPHRMVTIWNDHCINCHSTGGNPGLKGPKSLETAVGELGISCEACHGPGENHVAFHEGRPSNPASSSTVALAHPEKLNHKRSSQVCGQCHGIFIRQGEQGMTYAREGIQFRPGEDLHAVRSYIQFPDADASPAARQVFQRNRDFFRERWWDDGTMLAGGREYSAMLRSPCYQRGKLSCLSCHSLHDYADANDQLAVGMDGNRACTQCHEEERFTTDVQLHSHHRADSPGSNCMNCHMPHTSYALFSAIRNHTITSPNVDRTVKYNVLNACNLCHLDKTLDWTQNRLNTWFGHPTYALDRDFQETAAAVLWTLRGHAAQRVIVAWHYGWQPAQLASSVDWMVPIVSQLLRDPYGVVRHVAERSLRTLPEGAEIEYDFLAPRSDQTRVIEALISAWAGGLRQDRSADIARAVLLDADGKLLENTMDAFLRARDNRPVSIKE